MLNKGVNMEFSIEQVRKTTVESLLKNEKIREQFDYVIDIINSDARKGNNVSFISQIQNPFEIIDILKMYGFSVECNDSLIIRW